MRSVADVSIKFDTKFDARGFERGIRDIEKKLADMDKAAWRLGGSFSSLDSRGSKAFSNLNKSIDTSVVKFNGFGKAVNVAMAAVTALIGALAAGGLAAKSFLQTAARTETLNVAMEAVARANGIAIETVKEHKKAVMEMGIAEQEATQITTRFLQAQLDTADAAKVARVAQDAAVIANMNSSEAAERMVEAIAKLNPELLDVFGFTRNLNDIYADYSATVGKTAQQLSEHEKRQAILNYILQEGTKIAGTYEASMTTAGKQIGSLSRHWQTFQNALATPFLPALAKAVEGVTNALVSATAWLENNRATLEAWGQTLADIIGFFFRIEKKAADTSKKAVQHVTPKEISNQTQPIEDQTEAINEQGKAIENNAKKAKKASRQLQSFDQLNRLAREDDGSSGSGSGVSGGGSSGRLSSNIKPSDYSMEPKDLGADKLENTLDRMTGKLMKFAKEWGLIDFYKKIKEGIDKVDWENIRRNLDRISEGWGNIGKAAGEAIKEIVKAVIIMFGTVFKYMIAILGTLFDMFIEGFADFTEEMEEEIIKWIENVGDNLREGIENVTAVYEIIGEIILNTLNKYRDRIVNAFKTTFINISRLLMLIGTVISDVYNQITGRIRKFLEDNEEDVQLFVDNVSEILLDIWDALNVAFDTSLTLLEKLWEQTGEDLVNLIMDIFDDLVERMIRHFNEIAKPAWDEFVEELSRVWKEHIEVLIDPMVELVGKLIELLDIIWNDFISPLISYLQDELSPVTSFVFKSIGVAVTEAVRIIGDVLGGLIKTLTGIVDFLIGIFTGDWKRAWSGIKNIFIGIFEGIAGLLKNPINAIISMINGLIERVVSGINIVADMLNGMSFSVPEWVPIIGGNSFNFSMPKITAPKIPHLAKGGLIPPRKPRPVIVGDNMVEDEIISPVSTMKEAMAEVLASHAAGRNDYQLVQLLREIRDLLEEGSVIEMDEREFGRAVQKAARNMRRQTGLSLT